MTSTGNAVKESNGDCVVNRPGFSETEQFLIDSYRRPPSSVATHLSTQDAVLTVPAAAIVFLGLSLDNTMIVAVGSGLMFLHRSFDISRTVKWGLVLHSIFRQHEEALGECSTVASSESRTP